MRAGVLVAVAVAIGVAAFVAHERPERPAASPPPARPAAIEADRPVAAPARPASAPVTPRYAARPQVESGGPPPIYRCSDGGRTVYTQEPCANGRIVETANAVDGFDSRPSQGLQRFVAEGRDATPARPTTPSYGTRPRASVDDATAECPPLARAIVEIDAAARQPNTPERLDELRRVRQKTRDRMAFLRC